MLPEAHASHQTAERLRLKIPSQRGSLPYFKRVLETLSRLKNMDRVEVNAQTGSVLLVKDDLDLADLAEYAKNQKLFTVITVKKASVPISQRLMQPLGKISRSVHKFSGGEIDLASMAFLSLLGVGVYQLIRGNLRAPPWYTAFWYALGLFTKSLVEKKTDK
jgi:hypothetical protein